MTGFQIPRVDLMSRKGYWTPVKNPRPHPCGLQELEYVLYTEEELAEREDKVKLQPREEQQLNESSVPKTPASPSCMAEYWTRCECSTCKFKRMLAKIADRNKGIFSDDDDDANDADDEKSIGQHSGGGEHYDSSWDDGGSGSAQESSEDEGEASDPDEELLSPHSDEACTSKNSSLDNDKKSISAAINDAATSAAPNSASNYGIADISPLHDPFIDQHDTKESRPALSKEKSERSPSVGTPEQFFTPPQCSGARFGSSFSSTSGSSIYDLPPPKFKLPQASMVASPRNSDIEVPPRSSDNSAANATSPKSPVFNDKVT